MNVTIYSGYDDRICHLNITSGSSDIREAWRMKYGGAIEAYTRSLMKVMMDISDWANNELGVGCSFDCE